jgi:filamentous hemagglutinin family protein
MRYIGPFRQVLICILVVCITHLTNISPEVSAQTAPITSSGLNTQISAPIQVDGQTQYNITGGTRPEGGANLFHSFGEFGVPNNNIANFRNDFPGLQTFNILGRVTGGSESHILGTIRTSEFGSANLFLMNPAGFLFGPNATVNVGGMVNFTSADYLKLEDGKQFNAIPNTTADALLSASPVAAFGFLGSNPGAIIVQGSEFNGASISLVGGNITIESGTPSGGTAQQAKLSAANGTIQLASATSPGAFDTTLQAISNVNGASFTTFGTVSLAPGSTINISGTNTVSIRGGQFVLSVNDVSLNTATNVGTANSISLSPNSSIISSHRSIGAGADIQIATTTLLMKGAQATSQTTGNGDAGSIRINAELVDIIDGSTLSTETHGSGAGGTVTIDNARTINVLNASTISTLSEGEGKAGNIVLNAADSITLSKSFINSDAASFSSGVAGDGGLIHLKAPRINISESLLSTSTLGAGDAGSILLEAQRLTAEIDTDISAFTQGPGKGGKITIQGLDGEGSSANDVAITGGSVLRSRTSREGDAGEIRINAGRLMISDNSQINANSETGSGAGGNIYINANSITLQNGGTVSATTSGTTQSASGGTISIETNNLHLRTGAKISTETTGAGEAGKILIGKISPAQLVLIDDSAISSNTTGTGTGGEISIKAASMALSNGATISADSAGAADAGDINVTATDGLTMQNSSITTRVPPSGTGSNARGGDIKITTSPNATVYLRDNSMISASVPGSGNGGNVTIDPKFVVLQNSHILAQADQGTGGNITIIASVFQHDATSVVSADAHQGVNGTVTIQSPNAPASGKVQPLGNRPLQATSLLNQRCAAVAGGEFSSFTMMGRGNLPTEPGGWLASPLTPVISEVRSGTMTETGLRPSLDAPMGKRSLLSLRQIAPPGFLMHANAVESSSKGCRS